MPKFPYPATLHQFDETVKLPSELTVIFQEVGLQHGDIFVVIHHPFLEDTVAFQKVIRELGLFTFEGRVYGLDDL